MKKTISTIIAALTLAASASAVEPLYSLTWTAEGGMEVIAPKDSASTWQSFGEAFTYTEDGDSAVFGNSVLPATSAALSGIGQNYTLSFDIKAGTDTALTTWRTLVGLQSKGVQNDNHALQLHHTGNGLALYNGKAYGHVSAAGSYTELISDTDCLGSFSSMTEWVNITIVSDVTNSTLSLYVDGEKVGSYTDWAPRAGVAGDDYSLTGLSFGRNSSAASNRLFNADVQINNIKIYNTASVPEPTTATLSLLALAGLAARRRRK